MRTIWIVISVLAVFMTMAITAAVIITPQDCGEDKECFIALAKECNRATMTQTLETGSVIIFDSKDCVVNVRFGSFSTAETTQITDALQYKSMQCTHAKGEFDPSIIDIFGSNTCTGNLKDALHQLLVEAANAEKY
jgi:hypothetical protein